MKKLADEVGMSDGYKFERAFIKTVDAILKKKQLKNPKINDIDFARIAFPSIVAAHNKWISIRDKSPKTGKPARVTLEDIYNISQYFDELDLKDLVNKALELMQRKELKKTIPKNVASA